MIDPEIGSEKKGDLRGIRVHKYKFNRQELLLAYSIQADEILLITIGSHDTYYRDLKGHVNSQSVDSPGWARAHLAIISTLRRK